MEIALFHGRLPKSPDKKNSSRPRELGLWYAGMEANWEIKIDKTWHMTRHVLILAVLKNLI